MLYEHRDRTGRKGRSRGNSPNAAISFTITAAGEVASFGQEARAAYKHAESSIENGWNLHYRTTGPALMAQYMSTPAPIEPMPDRVRSALLLAGL